MRVKSPLVGAGRPVSIGQTYSTRKSLAEWSQRINVCGMIPGVVSGIVKQTNRLRVGQTKRMACFMLICLRTYQPCMQKRQQQQTILTRSCAFSHAAGPFVLSFDAYGQARQIASRSHLSTLDRWHRIASCAYPMMTTSLLTVGDHGLGYCVFLVQHP